MDETGSMVHGQPRTYTEEFKKSIVEDYEAKMENYPSTCAYAREKGIPDNTLFGWIKKYGRARPFSGLTRMAVGGTLKASGKGMGRLHRISVNGVRIEGDAASLAAVIGAMAHADN